MFGIDKEEHPVLLIFIPVQFLIFLFHEASERFLRIENVLNVDIPSPLSPLTLPQVGQPRQPGGEQEVERGLGQLPRQQARLRHRHHGRHRQRRPGRHLQEGDPPAAGQHRDGGHPGRGAVSVAVSAVSAVHSAVSTNLSRCRVQNPENRMVATTRSLDTAHIE